MPKAVATTTRTRSLRSIAGNRKSWCLAHDWEFEIRGKHEQEDRVCLLGHGSSRMVEPVRIFKATRYYYNYRRWVWTGWTSRARANEPSALSRLHACGPLPAKNDMHMGSIIKKQQIRSSKISFTGAHTQGFFTLIERPSAGFKTSGQLYSPPQLQVFSIAFFSEKLQKLYTQLSYMIFYQT